MPNFHLSFIIIIKNKSSSDMKAYSLVKFEGLANTQKKAKDLQNADLTRPKEEDRQKKLDETR